MSFGIEPRTPLGDSRLYGWAMENSPANTVKAFGKKLFKESLPFPVRLLAGARPKRPFFSPLASSRGASAVDVPVHQSLSAADFFDSFPLIRPLRSALPSSEFHKKLVMLSAWLAGREQRGMRWDGRLAIA